jgi:hypothetical protein
MTGVKLARTVLTALVIVVSVRDTALGQSPLQQRLARATALECSFSVLAKGTWKGGVPSADVTTAKLTVTFKNINIDEGTADVGSALSASASSLVVVRYANDYLHLLQSQGDGPLYTTTVIARETKEGRLMAVHDRHEYTDISLPGFTSRPEMYLGDCAVQ